ncbi:hypothetical protein BDV95DRAFT_559112 [Massariosphaeria phaeospora]|uniref:Uncharacterized protein n=1 Tax=Massariosphaeria phaeospora TaxID=100035 RepID=A0A7C8IPT8_9PLEO|nr:hypothetical protein BDV95DRAFT_559112 [Massariosphaeria phaeospora]
MFGSAAAVEQREVPTNMAEFHRTKYPQGTGKPHFPRPTGIRTRSHHKLHPTGAPKPRPRASKISITYDVAPTATATPAAVVAVEAAAEEDAKVDPVADALKSQYHHKTLRPTGIRTRPHHRPTGGPKPPKTLVTKISVSYDIAPTATVTPVANLIRDYPAE